jgi:hypothetical protein
MQHEAEQRGLSPEEEVVIEKVEVLETLLEEDDGEILDVIEIEMYAATRKRKPRARLYKFRVGKTLIEVKDPIITGRRILELAGKVPPDKYTLRQVEHGGVLARGSFSTWARIRRGQDSRGTCRRFPPVAGGPIP